MLSRLAFRSVRLLPTNIQGSQIIRTSATTTDKIYSNNPSSGGTESSHKLVPFQSDDVRPINIPPVRMGFIPDSWFQFFYPKTGVTGPYMFMVGVSTYLLSKEIYVLEHEFFNALTFIPMIVVVIKMYGPALKNYLIKKQDNMINAWDSALARKKASYQNAIKEFELGLVALDGAELMLAAKKQYIKIQLEAIYRQHLADVHNNVKKCLDYQVQVNSAKRRLEQKYMAQWIISNVLKAITPEQEKAALQQCIQDLRGLAKA